MVRLYREPHFYTYYSGKCSYATLYFIIITSLIVILPYVLISATPTPHHKTYYAQPTVTYTNNYLLEATGDSQSLYYATNIPDQYEAYSRSQIGALQLNPSIKATHLKKDNIHTDGITIQIIYPCTANHITLIRIMLEFSYSIDGFVKYSLSQPILYEFSGTEIGGGVAKGTLLFKQQYPLFSSEIPKHTYNETILKEDQGKIWDKLNDRNENIILTNLYSKTKEECTTEATYDIYLSIPKAKVVYIQRVLHSFISVWSQYFSVLYPIYICLSCFLGWTFKSKILPT